MQLLSSTKTTITEADECNGMELPVQLYDVARKREKQPY